MLLRHSFEVADMHVAGRSLLLACVPFNTPAWVADDGEPYREVHRPTVATGLDPTRTQLRYQHSDDMINRLGVGAEFRPDPRYLLGEFRVVSGARGDHLLDLVESGQLRGVSVGFVPGPSNSTADEDGPLVERLRYKRLPEVSLVDAPAYTGAEVLAVARARRVEAERAELLAFLADERRHAALWSLSVSQAPRR
jgi:HK97 family phage prohead protease